MNVPFYTIERFMTKRVCQSAVHKFSSRVMNSACKELSPEHVCTLQNASKCNSNVEQQNLELYGVCGTLLTNSPSSPESVFL